MITLVGTLLAYVGWAVTIVFVLMLFVIVVARIVERMMEAIL